jgi:D-xylose transport system substrate-binding protein
MKKPIRLMISIVAVGAFAAVGFSGIAGAQHRVVSSAAPAVKVAFENPETFTGRWIKDHAYFDKEMKKLDPNVTIIYHNSNANIVTQQQNVDADIAAGVKVIVLAAVDQNQDAPLVNKAEAAGIKVLAYDRMIQSPKLRAYDSFDNVGVGKEQGSWFKANAKKGSTIVEIRGSTTDQNAHLFYKGFCKEVCSAISKGTYHLCYWTWTPNWTPATAGTEMDAAYTKCGTKIGAVYSMNDGMAAAVYSSIKRHTTKHIPLTGQDAQPDGLGRILLHEQGMTVFKFVKLEADAAAQLAYSWITGHGLPKTYKKNCGADCVQASGRHVPSALFVPESITLKNVADPVKKGFDTWGTTAAGIGVCPSIGINTSKPYCGLKH